MPRLFIDSSVLFSAAYSSKGHSRDLIMLGAAGKINLVISDFVVEETRRNLALSRPGMTVLEQIFREARMEVVTVSRHQVQAAMRIVVPKDAAILAAAKVAKVDMLVTLDRKHLLNHPELEKYLNAPILTPAEAVSRIKEHE